MERKNLELKVGIFILVGVAVLMLFVLSLGRNRFFKERITFVAEFEFVEGLKPLSPVSISGHEVGLVKSVEVSSRGTPVYVYVEVDKRLNIPRDSDIFINSLGLLGEKYVEILPGTSFESIKQSDVIKGNSSIPLKIISDQIKEIAEGFSGLVEGLNSALNDPELGEDVKELIRNLSDTFAQAHKILVDVEKEKGTVGRLIYDDSLYTKFEEFLADIEKNPWKLFHVPRKKK